MKMLTNATILMSVHRINFGSALLHLAVESTRKDTRQATNKMISEAAFWDPHLTTTLIRESVVASLCRVSSTKTTTGEDAPALKKHSRLASVLLSSVTYDGEVDMELKEELVTELIVVGHHEFVC